MTFTAPIPRNEQRQMHTIIQKQRYIPGLRQWLPGVGIVWRRAAPTLHIHNPLEAEKMAAITDAVGKNSASNPVF